MYPMGNAINTLRIQNFKSIKDATIHPRRVNLIIGHGQLSSGRAVPVGSGKFAWCGQADG